MITIELAMEYGTAYEMLSSKLSKKDREEKQMVMTKLWTDWSDKLLLNYKENKPRL